MTFDPDLQTPLPHLTLEQTRQVEKELEHAREQQRLEKTYPGRPEVGRAEIAPRHEGQRR
jgi:hypothetical protein